MKNKNFDTCVSFLLEKGAFIGRLIRLDQILDIILKNHNYPLNVSSAVVETTTLTSLCSALLKYEGLFTLQIQGNGPVSLLVTDVTDQNKVRSCAKFDVKKLEQAKKLRKTGDVFEELPHLVGGGYMALTIDEQKGMPPYQGVVDLKGKTLTDFALRYFKNSEQIDTHLKLLMKKPQDESLSFLSAGIIVQKAPLKGGKQEFNEDEINLKWEDIKAFIDSLKEDEVFDNHLSSDEILHRLFHSNDLKITGQKEYSFGCRCSREKLLNTLRSFDEKEIENLCDKNDLIEATCHFCSQKYQFKKEELFQNNSGFKH